jgi:hypothetical protein
VLASGLTLIFDSVSGTLLTKTRIFTWPSS